MIRGQTVGDMNKTHNSNVIENIFLDFLVPIFFGRWRHLVVNNFFVFYGQTVGDMNKTHNTSIIENICVQFCEFFIFW